MSEIPDYYKNVRNDDGSYSQVEMCYDVPTPTNPPPSPSSNPVTTNHTNPQPTPNSTTPPIVYIEVNDDGDAYSLTARQDTGEIVNAGYEIDDNSAGEGDPGLVKLRAEFEARGLSFDADPDKVGFYTLVGLTVSPSDFAKYIDLLANTPVTTTTTIPVTTTTTTTIPVTTTTTTTIPVTSTSVKVAAGASGDKSDSSGDGGIGFGELAGPGALLIGLSGVIIYLGLRRHNHHQPRAV
jgi:hypothetical protein